MIELPQVRAENALRRAQGGDSDAFEELIALNESMVFSIALHSLGDRKHAEDVAQEAFLQLYRNLHQFESAAHLTAWLRRTTTNRCIDAIRSRRDSVPLDSAAEEMLMTDDPAPDHYLHSRLRNLVSGLPEQQRMAVILRYQEGMEPAEISEAIHVPLNTVKSHLRRALSNLRVALGINTSQPNDEITAAALETRTQG